MSFRRAAGLVPAGVNPAARLYAFRGRAMHPISRRDFARRFGSAALAAAAGSVPADEPRRERIKVGQVGVGHAHATKLAVYRQSVDYEVVGVVEPDAVLRRRAEGQPAFKDVPWLTR